MMVRTEMFIVVLFGDSQQEIFNPNCKNVLLIENIKKRCNCKENEIIDLAEESGVVKNLNERPSEQFANEYLEFRCSYILVNVRKQVDVPSGQIFKTYTALLNGLEESNPDFMAKIASQNRVAANRSTKSAKQNVPRQGKGGLKPSKTTAVPSTRSKSIVNKKRA